MADRYRGGIYVEMTADLMRRIYQYREGTGSIHVTEYGKTRLLCSERHEEIGCVIAPEKLVRNEDALGNLL
jgi:putative endonuclease